MSEANLDKKIVDLQFTNKWITSRIHNSLPRNGIHTIGQLVQQSRGDLLAMPTFGATCMAEITAKLEAMGLKLRDPGW